MNVFLKAKSHNADGFSNIVALGDFVFVSGQLGQGKTFDEQCRSVFEKMEDLLACYNLACRHIVKMTVYLSNLDNKGKFLDMFKEDSEKSKNRNRYETRKAKKRKKDYYEDFEDDWN